MKERPRSTWMIAVLLLGLAAWLRFARLDEVPSCLEYDEAANVILAGEIARGQSFPVFIRPYTGKEVLYFYLAAGVMRLAGVTPFALRLTSAYLGILSVALTWFCAREIGHWSALFPSQQRWWAILSAGMVAVSYWQVHLSRFGYRAIVLPPVLALALGALLRGLRVTYPIPGRDAATDDADRKRRALKARTMFLLRELSVSHWQWVVTAGAASGLAAYTYSSVRVLPVLLALIWGWVLVVDRRMWRVRLVQFLVFGLVAALVFAPLGIFFLRYPETFTVRLDQVSILSPAVNQGDLWRTLWRTLRLAAGMFTVSGDMNPLYNAPGRPVFDPFLGSFFYLGLLVCVGLPVVSLLMRKRGCPRAASTCRAAFLFLLAWLVVMMVPNVLSASGVPHNLRAMALVPAVYIVTALGIVWAAGWIARNDRSLNWVYACLLAALLIWEGGHTYRDYWAWARSPDPYYKGNEALIRAAALLNEHPEADPYVATSFHQHATLAVHARNYTGIRWMSGGTLVLPPPGARPALLVYDHTNPVEPLLYDSYLAPSLYHREYGPDGEVAFEAFWLEGEEGAVQPSIPYPTNLGNTLTFLGYDLAGETLSGQTLDVTLYVRVEHEVERSDYTFLAHLVDPLGFRWAEETFFHYPPAQWRAGEVMLFSLHLPIAPGAPPGDYRLQVGVFSSSLDARLPVLNKAGQMAGTTVDAGPIPVAPAASPPEDLPAIQSLQRAEFGSEIVFLGSDRDRSDLLPGQALALTLYWQRQDGPMPPRQVVVTLSGAQGEVPLWHGDPVQGRYPFVAWPDGTFIRDRYRLRLPVDVQAGDYDLRLSVTDAAGEPVPTVQGDPFLSLGMIHVHASDRLWEPPDVQQAVGARLGEAFELVGYTLAQTRVQPGETLHLDLVWRCRESVEQEYTVFTHLLDAGGFVRGQKDNPPVMGSYPTTLWVPGEIVVDRYAIPVDADAPAGHYTIEVGMYDPATIQRLPVLDPSGVTGDRVLVGEIEVVAGN